ncbi:hypothetical protein D3C77_671560 [compost metagenome]
MGIPLFLQGDNLRVGGSGKEVHRVIQLADALYRVFGDLLEILDRFCSGFTGCLFPLDSGDRDFVERIYGNAA